MRKINAGIFRRTIIETREDWFGHDGLRLRGGELLGSVNSVHAVAECAKRARKAFREVFNLPPEDTSTKNGNVVVHLDSSRRPLTDTKDRDENWSVSENLLRLSRRDLRKNPVLYDVRALLFAERVFHLTLQEREALVRKQHEFRPVEFLRKLTLLDENLRCMTMRIGVLDKQIEVAPYEDLARRGKENLDHLKNARRQNAAEAEPWETHLRVLIAKPEWKGKKLRSIADYAHRNKPAHLEERCERTIRRYLKKIIRSKNGPRIR
jgi:hypothetical protein